MSFEDILKFTSIFFYKIVKSKSVAFKLSTIISARWSAIILIVKKPSFDIDTNLSIAVYFSSDYDLLFEKLSDILLELADELPTNVSFIEVELEVAFFIVLFESKGEIASIT